MAVIDLHFVRAPKRASRSSAVVVRSEAIVDADLRKE